MYSPDTVIVDVTVFVALSMTEMVPLPRFATKTVGGGCRTGVGTIAGVAAAACFTGAVGTVSMTTLVGCDPTAIDPTTEFALVSTT
jgi:hypothetical protein